MTPTTRVLLFTSIALLVAGRSALAQQSAPQTTSPASTAPPTSSADLDEIVVHGIKRGELILPTQVSSDSAYGLDLGVMDTPRNNTLLSKAQLDALNIQNPGGFSYLTASSYSDASFGQPNVPRIRGQYADLFFNGMRDSFTLNGYGAPISFNSVDSIDIVKGPASVQAGPGAGVGGAIDVTTKMPSFSNSIYYFNLEADTQEKRRASFDVGTPLSSTMAVRVAYTGDFSGSYYNTMYFHQQSVFAALLTEVTPKYTVLVTGGVEITSYRENDGINRVNQGLIDNNTYLTGAPPPSSISGFGTEVILTGSTELSGRTIIDEPPGTGAQALHIKGQIIQTFKAADDFSIVNNTFYDYLNRYNQTMDYYADTAKGSYTIENKTDFKFQFQTGAFNNDVDAGFTYRYAHVLDIQNESIEPVSVFDLSQNPNTWVVPDSAQPGAGAVVYQAAYNRNQWGVSGRTSGFLNGTADSNLQDVAVFAEYRLQFSPQWSVLAGVRGDLVQLNYSDPLTGPYIVAGLPVSASTAWYGLYNGNISVVYSPSSHISAYLTANTAQYVDPTANDGGVATWGEDPTAQLRQDTTLYEAGIKFDLLDKALFMSAAIYKQSRSIPSGQEGLIKDEAHIHGAEIELNYQPDPHFFATASYSYIRTTLDQPELFWNFPAQPGVNYDGAGVGGFVWAANQTFLDPGIPESLFNVLANYKWESGFGVQANLQVTSPISTSQSGYINLAASANAYLPIPAYLNSNGGDFQAPRIPTQSTLNAALFYSFSHYTLRFSVYNVMNRNNFVNDQNFYGNDFITRLPPRDYDLSFSGKF